MRKLIVFLGDFYPECAPFCAELQNSVEYDFLPFVVPSVLTQQPWLLNFTKVFKTRTANSNIINEVRSLNPFAILVRSWTGFAGINLPEAIYWKMETMQRESPNQPLPRVNPTKPFRAMLTQNHVEVPVYKDLGIPVGWLPRGVSHNWEKPLPKTYDVMVTGTAIQQTKIDSFKLLMGNLISVLSPEQLRVYINAGGIPEFAAYRKPTHPAEQGPTLMAQAKIFISPVTTRFDPGIISHKTVQAMACRTLTLTQRYVGVEDLMGKDGENLIYADTPEEAKEKVLYYLSHDVEREAIAERGYNFIHAKYNVTKIIKQAFKEIGVE